MTPDEQNLLQRFLGDLAQTRGVAKDPEADAMINQALQAAPDAAYILVQHAILSDQALHAAQDQIAALQNQLRAPVPAPQAASYLPPAQTSWMPPQPSQYVGAGPFSSGGGLGSFMKSAAPIAAGVVGGSLLFDGIALFGN